MSTAMSATEAKRKLGEVIRDVADRGDEVIVQNHGRPQAAIISYASYQQFQRLREQARRAAALDEVRRLRDRVRQRNQDLTAEQAEALADRFVRDVVAEMAAAGKIRFEPGE